MQIYLPRNGKTLPIVLGVVCLALIGAALLIFKSAHATTVPTLDEARAATDLFLTEIRNGKVDAAWASAASDFKSFLGREGFRRFVASHPALKLPLDFAESRSIQLDGSPKLECSFRSTIKAGQTPAEVRLLLAFEDGKWKVERCEVNPLQLKK